MRFSVIISAFVLIFSACLAQDVASNEAKYEVKIGQKTFFIPSPPDNSVERVNPIDDEISISFFRMHPKPLYFGIKSSINPEDNIMSDDFFALRNRYLESDIHRYKNDPDTLDYMIFANESSFASILLKKERDETVSYICTVEFLLDTKIIKLVVCQRNVSDGDDAKYEMRHVRSMATSWCESIFLANGIIGRNIVDFSSAEDVDGEEILIGGDVLGAILLIPPPPDSSLLLDATPMNGTYLSFRNQNSRKMICKVYSVIKENVNHSLSSEYVQKAMQMLNEHRKENWKNDPNTYDYGFPTDKLSHGSWAIGNVQWESKKTNVLQADLAFLINHRMLCLGIIVIDVDGEEINAKIEYANEMLTSWRDDILSANE